MRKEEQTAKEPFHSKACAPEAVGMKKVWYDKAWEQFSEIIQINARMAKRINALLQCIDRNGYNCIGQPEPLKGDLTDWWSVQIDKANRLVFQIVGEELVIYSCAGHYE